MRSKSDITEKWKAETIKQAKALSLREKCEHNYLIKTKHSGWLTRPGGREMKTVYCSKCLKERDI